MTKVENDLQYAITSRVVKKFARALENADQDTAGLDPLLQQAIRDALQSLLDELQAELEEYDTSHGSAPAVRGSYS